MDAELHIPDDAVVAAVHYLMPYPNHHDTYEALTAAAPGVVAVELRRLATELINIVLDENNVNADRQRPGINLAVRRLRWRADELDGGES